MYDYFPFNIFKYIGGKKLPWFIFSKLIEIYLYIFIICNLDKFKKRNTIFINSFAFGHSVTESSIFFHEYGNEGLCISVGNKYNRNKYLKLFFEPYVLLHLWLPRIRDINIYHALRKRVHGIIESLFEQSKLLNAIIGRKLSIIQRENLLDNAAINNLIDEYNYSEASAVELLENFDSVYRKTMGEKASSSLHYLVQQKSLINPKVPIKLERENLKFIQMCDSYKSEGSSNKLKVCTLILRKSWKPWSGKGLNSYLETIQYLHSKKYFVIVIGDLDEFITLRKNKSLENVFYHRDFRMNLKLFQILAIINSDFCIGDQSGLQALIHFFSKKNFTVNTIPFGQLQYNSVILPRIWFDENGDKLSISDHLENFLYRIHSVKDEKGVVVGAEYHQPKIILKAAKDFIETCEKQIDLNELNLDNIFNFKSNCMARFSKNSYFSPVLIDELK